jgi:small-conductance mechanosensitive channel
MQRRSALIASLSVLLTLTWAVSVSAQGDPQKDAPRLIWRYDTLLKARTPQAQDAVKKGIDEERTAIRTEMEKELSATLKALAENKAEPVDLVRVLDQQRSIVSSLNEKIDAARADLSLLEREEGFYVQREKTGTGAPPLGQIMLTKSHPELLAKKAILSDRITVLQAFLKTESDRLNELKSEQQVRSMGILWSILTYLGVFLIVFWAERIIRTILLSRIRPRRLRYTATKTFTFIVYVSLIFWSIQRIYSEHPEITTVLAVIGAALVFVTQDILKGIIGWFGMKNSLSLGQRVSIGPLTGDVIDIGLLHTTLLVSRTALLEEVGQVGKLVRIPNERLLSQHVVNYHSTSDFENVEFPLRLARSDQWEAAQKILEEILRKETDAFAERAKRQTDQRMRGFYAAHTALSWRVYLELTPEGEAQFTVCFPAPIGQRRAVTAVITREILRRFKEAGISFSSP